MTYEASTDEPVLALRQLARYEVTRLLASELGDTTAYPAVRKTYGFPIPLDMLRSLELPACAIYVDRERTVSTGRWRDRGLSVVVEYVLPPTQKGSMDTRWPLLRRVWDTMLPAFVLGTVDLGAGPVDVKAPAGIVKVDDETATCSFAFVPDGAQTFPGFVARLEVVERPAVALDLPDLVALYADLNLHEGVTETRPQIVQIIAP